MKPKLLQCHSSFSVFKIGLLKHNATKVFEKGSGILTLADLTPLFRKRRFKENTSQAQPLGWIISKQFQTCWEHHLRCHGKKIGLKLERYRFQCKAHFTFDVSWSVYMTSGRLSVLI